MSTPPKPYVKPQPPTKDQLRQMLAQAVRNTAPELNLVQEPEPKAKKRRGRPASSPAAKATAKRPSKRQKKRA